MRGIVGAGKLMVNLVQQTRGVNGSGIAVGCQQVGFLIHILQQGVPAADV
jgi:hypothetical protein